MSSLNKLVPRVCSYIEVVVEGTVELVTSSIVINREGRVAGFKACLSQGIHLSLQPLLSSAWDVHCNEGLLVNPIDGDTQCHSLQDILRSVLTFERRRRAADKTVSKQCKQNALTCGAERWWLGLPSWQIKLSWRCT